MHCLSDVLVAVALLDRKTPNTCIIHLQLQIKMWKGKEFIGAAAGRYHSVFFTRNEVYSCGLNAGQLGKDCPLLPRITCTVCSAVALGYG